MKPLCVGLLWGPLGARQHLFGYDSSKQRPDDVLAFLLLQLEAIEGVSEWWAHNLGRFDGLFVVNGVKALGWEMDASLADSRLIEGRITTRSGKTIRLLDSFNVAPASLKTNAVDFELQARKLFQAEDYKGDMRAKPLAELQAGCLADCEMVLQLLERLDTMASDWGGSLKRTFAATSMSILKSDLKRRNTPFPDFSKKQVWVNRMAEEAMAGGRTEVLHHAPKGPLVEMDVTSSYPWAMAQPHPWQFLGHVGDPRVTLKAYEEAKLPMLVRAKVWVPKCDIPPLPFRLDLTSKNVFFPTGHWEGWFVAEELRHAESLGVEVVLKDCLLFEEADLFSEFVNKIFEKKRASTGAMRAFCKFLLNSCYGKFGEAPEHERLKLMASAEEAFEFMQARRGKVAMPYGDPRVLSVAHFQWAPHAHYALAATIAARSRVLLHKGLLSAVGAAYCDTDAVHCQRWTGEVSDALGGWKEELRDYDAEFFSPKLYRLTERRRCECRHEGDCSMKECGHKHHTLPVGGDRGRPLHLAAKGFPVNPAAFEEVLGSATGGPKVRVQRMRLLKSQLRDNDGRTARVLVEKQWKGMSQKRRPLADGRTVPWTVKELQEGKHLTAACPLLAPPPEVECDEEGDEETERWWPSHPNG